MSGRTFFKRVIGTAVVVAASTAILAAPASAAPEPTGIELLFFSATGPSAGVGGTLISQNDRCLRDRKVALTVIYADSEKRVDVARSGRNGGWFARVTTAEIDDSDGIRVKVAPTRAGGGKKAIRCGGAKLESI